MARLINERTRLVFIANPNNPTGTWVERGRVASLHRSRAAADAGRRRRGVHRIRRATPDFPDASRWLARVSESDRHAHVLEGLRPGRPARRLCAVASVAWPTCSIACASRSTSTRSRSPRRAPRSTTREHLQRSVEIESRRHGAAARGLRRARRAAICRRAGNFVLIDCAGRRRRSTKRCCAGRDRAARRQLRLPNHLRLTIGTPAQNERMLRALLESSRSAVRPS